MMQRRALLAGGLAVIATRAVAQTTGHEGHGGMYEGLRQPGRVAVHEVFTLG